MPRKKRLGIVKEPVVESQPINYVPNKKIINRSLQGLEIFIKTNTGPGSIWLVPGGSVVVSENSITNQLLSLQARRILKIIEV
jgi:hypothetical protein